MTHKRARHYHKPRAHSGLLSKPKPGHAEFKDVAPKPASKASSMAAVQPPQPPQRTAAHHGIEIEIPGDMRSVMRKDYFTDSYVIISPKRNQRPLDFNNPGSTLTETATSPRLDLQDHIDGIYDRQGHWKTLVVDNKYPALTLDNPLAFGKQEMIIDTPQANTPMGKLDRGQLALVFQTYQKRTEALLKIAGIKYVVVFKNDGVRAGASLAHAHSQIFATPLIPTKVARISAAVEQYFHKTNKPPYDTVIEFERSQKSRVISENEHFITFCPFAPRWPLDVWIVPLKHYTSLTELTKRELDGLAASLHQIVAKLTRHHIDYNFYLENGVSPNHRFALKLQARSINWWAGFEMATDIAINPIPPELAAQWYRSNS